MLAHCGNENASVMLLTLKNQFRYIMCWGDHMVTVTACLYMNPVSDMIAKMVLFKKMDTHTFPVITEDFAPYAKEMVKLSFEDYATLLGQVFQPVTESKTLKLMFIECKQQPNEHYETYVRNK